MWAVIHFFKDNSVEVVPNNWFNSKCGVCAWPKVNNNNLAKKYVRKRVVPNGREFIFLKARCFNGCSNIESLLEARSRLKQSEIFSDFSDAENIYQQRKKNVSLSPENASNEIGFDCPIISNAIDNSEKTMGAPLNTDRHSIEKVDEQVMSPNLFSLLDSSINTEKKLGAPLNTDHHSIEKVDEQVSPDLFSIDSLCLTPVRVNSTRSPKFNQKNSSIKKIKSQALFKKKVHSTALNDDIFKTIMRNQLIFKFKLRTIEEKQDVIIKMLEDQANKQIFSNGDNSLIDYNPMADLYPIEGLDDLNKIEEQILLDTEYRKKIVHDLSNNIGGKNVNSSVKKMMIQLFDDKLLAQFSFAGRKLTSKKSFQSLGFYKIIDEATKKMSKFKGVVRQEEIDDAIKYMLIQAPFRLKRKTEQENAALLK